MKVRLHRRDARAGSDQPAYAVTLFLRTILGRAGALGCQCKAVARIAD